MYVHTELNINSIIYYLIVYSRDRRGRKAGHRKYVDTQRVIMPIFFSIVIISFSYFYMRKGVLYNCFRVL